MTAVAETPGSKPRDLASREDIAALVTAFYGRAFADPLLGPIFIDVARLDLAAHLPIICDFWESVLLRLGTYRRDALHVHAVLHARSPLTPAHFARWLDLWTSTVDDLYQGERAERAKLQAGRIAGSLQRRLAGEPASELVTPARRRPLSEPT
ncbi:hemoglobin [Frankia sp. AiPs1]|uniref:group III truncated hemoglobin n=1 Tax=Frankia sp. AiPa1 TaxID=573492 RepID=UPI00202AEED1|nr:group III truncated hemoglobin [Frankia sp. AiPa1]MCL9761666.1 group III truncated hemoglobin [Frankia sp. AiPa1]